MKLTDWLTDAFGTDKILHFLGGGWITSILSPIGWCGILIGFVVMVILSFLKELFFDSFTDWKDILAATIGGVVSVLIYLIIFLLI